MQMRKKEDAHGVRHVETGEGLLNPSTVRIRNPGQDGWVDVPVPPGASPVREALRTLLKEQPPLVGDGWWVIELQ